MTAGAGLRYDGVEGALVGPADRACCHESDSEGGCEEGEEPHLC